MAIRNDILLSFSCFILLLRLSYSLTDKLLPGQQLRDGDELVSAFGKFRLKFFSPGNEAKRYLGIFSRIYGNAKPVWVANRNTPILDESGVLTIGSDGNLKILYNGGNHIAVSSIQGGRNTSATLLQSGNLELHETYSNGYIRRVLWQSFDYPTDTLLPGMKLGINLQTGHQWFLQSWITDISPAQGSFTLGMDPNGTNQLIICWRGEVGWTSPLWLNGQSNSSVPWTIGKYKFKFTSNEKEKYFSYYYFGEQDLSDPLHYFGEQDLSDPLLNRDYIGISSTGTSSIVTVFGGYHWHPELAPKCGRNASYFEDKYGFMSGGGFKFKNSENMSDFDCAGKCFNNCSCFAYATTNYDFSCEIWGREAKFKEAKSPFEINSMLIRILEPGPEPEPAPEPKPEPKPKPKRIRFLEPKIVNWRLPLTIAAALTLLVSLLCYLCYQIWRKLKPKVDSKRKRKKLLRGLRANFLFLSPYGRRKRQEKVHNINPELKMFDFHTIAAATNNFSTTNKLGEGGFGPVYKGQTPDGQEIAIKRLSRRSGQGLVEFENEAKLIAKLQHTNLVRLLGCSVHEDERILVYEYMPNKSLDFFIFDSNRKNILNWKKRFNIIEGIAQGLLYLHKYSRLKVIHRDLKASNILLDDQMNPKISDFGMARIFAMNESIANTSRVCGTYGYMSPEYALNGIVSTKIDVFSFGVLVLEIVSGKKNNSFNDTEQPLNLVGYAWQLWNAGKGLELMDPTLDESTPHNEVLRCLHAGLLCVQDQARDRPTIFNAVSMLTNETTVLPEPKQPAFFISNTPEEPEVPENKSENCSTNDVTISVLVAR